MTAQEAFEFADKLQIHYSNESGASSINDTLLLYLGEQKYKQFCRNFHEKIPREAVPKDSFAHFKESFAKSPSWHENILFDEHVRFFWGLSTIMEEVKKLLWKIPLRRFFIFLIPIPVDLVLVYTLSPFLLCGRILWSHSRRASNLFWELSGASLVRF